MANLTVTIPHQLSRAEARRRVAAEVERLRDVAPFGASLEHRWDGDTLNFRLLAVGQAVRGTARVEEQAVLVEVELPWMLAMLGELIKGRVEGRGRELLGGPQPTGRKP